MKALNVEQFKGTVTICLPFCIVLPSHKGPNTVIKIHILTQYHAGWTTAVQLLKFPLQVNNSDIKKNQHFVPQFYLRKFVNQNNEVQVLNVELMKITNPRGTKKICFDEYFYGVETGKFDAVSQEIENRFAEMEGYINQNLDPIVDKILNNRQIEIEDKRLIAFLMSMLWIRGPAMRSQIHQMEEQLTKWTLAHQFSVQPDKAFDRYDKETGKTTPPEMRETLRESFVNQDYKIQPDNVLHLKNLNDIPGYANLFYYQYWTVYVSKLSKKFVTTDNPVAVTFPKSKGFMYGRTFLERSHYFPLTPDIMIVATESDNPHPDKDIRLKRKTLFKGAENKVLDLNITMTRQATDYVYANEKRDLEDILAERKRQQEFFATPQGKIAKEKLDAEQQG